MLFLKVFTQFEEVLDLNKVDMAQKNLQNEYEKFRLNIFDSCQTSMSIIFFSKINTYLYFCGVMNHFNPILCGSLAINSVYNSR